MSNARKKRRNFSKERGDTKNVEKCIAFLFTLANDKMYESLECERKNKKKVDKVTNTVNNTSKKRGRK